MSIFGEADADLPLFGDVERRALLWLSAFGPLAGSPAMIRGEAVRQLLERMFETAEVYNPEDWELACLDHMHAVLTRPAAEARDGLIVDLMALHSQLERADGKPAPELRRVGAWLSALYANVLTRSADHAAARRWWATARHAADASGDLEMRVWVRGAEATFGLYAPRAPQSVITLAADARRLAGPRVSAGLMCAMSAEAQALATLDRPADAQRVLDELADACGRVSGGEGYGWLDDSLWYVRSWVCSFAGNERDAADARDHVVASSPSYQNVANARLHEAIGIARQGGRGAALILASEIVGVMEPAYRSHMILQTAGRVVHAIPADERDQPAARDLRALIEGAP